MGPDRKYEIVACLGKGGMGVVFRAFDHFLERDVAIKTILVEAGSGVSDTAVRAYKDRFVREARAVAKLTHPNIIQVYEIGGDQGRPFIAMEFVDGHDLAEIKERLTLTEICAACDGIAAALDYMHVRGVFHRDIKPQNVRFGRNGEIKLMDFGIAKDLHRATLTEYGMKLGTPLYMAPEILTDQPVFSAKSDQYALAVILYELLTMHYPFEGPSLEVLLTAARTLPPRSPRSYAPWVPEATENVILKGLAKSADDRFATSFGLASLFRRSLGDMEALQSIRNERWVRAEAIWKSSHEDSAALRALLAEYADWPQHEIVRERILTLEHEQQRRQTVNTLAREALEAARAEGSIEKLQAVATRFTNTGWGQEAERVIAEIEAHRAQREREDLARRQAEEAAYAAAVGARDPELLQQFAVEYPDSHHLPEAVALFSEIQREREAHRRHRLDRETVARNEYRNATLLRDGDALASWLLRYSDLEDLAIRVRAQLRLLETEARALEAEELKRQEDAEREIQQAFERIAVARDAEKLRAFLRVYPHRAEAGAAAAILSQIEQQQRQDPGTVERTQFEAAFASRDPFTLRALLEEYPHTSHRDAAVRCIEEWEAARHEEVERADYDEAVSSGNLQLFRRFLSIYPDSTRWDDVNARLAFAEGRTPDPPRSAAVHTTSRAQLSADEPTLRIDSEERDFEKAMNSHNAAELREFARRYPGSLLRTRAEALASGIEAWMRQGDLLFESALQERSLPLLEQFLRDHSGHPKAAEAQRVAERLRSRSLWRRAGLWAAVVLLLATAAAFWAFRVRIAILAPASVESDTGVPPGSAAQPGGMGAGVRGSP
jgi:serine/threonine protein kinase